MEELDATQVELDGVRLIEASAGTGKTFNITTLYLRLLIEARHPVSEILVVTFTKAAAAELRQRVRDRLREACEVFEARSVGDLQHQRGADSVLDRLADASVARGDLDGDLAWLVDGLRSFDEAAISTIHGFCEGVLEENAFESGVAFGTELTPNDSLLVDEVAQDYWTRALYDAEPDFVRWLRIKPSRSVRALAKLAAAGISPPGIEVLPAAPNPIDGEIGALGAVWHAAFKAACEVWEREGRAVLTLLREAAEGSILKKGSYPVKLEESWGAAIDRTLARPVPGLVTEAASKDGGFKAKFMRLARERVIAGTRNNESSPEHPLFDVFQQLADADVAYAAGLETQWLNTQIELVVYVRAELARRQRERRTRSFDRLLTDLADALDGPTGDALAENVRERHPVALIDEFQDTDPIQYRIFERIWGAPPAALFMIGDPKQAIYAFRGADIFAYIEAKRAAGDNLCTLDRNWRTDPELIRAVNCLFERSPSPFVFDEIPFHPALPARGAGERMLAEEGAGAPLRLLMLERDHEPKRSQVQSAQTQIPQAIAADIARLLASGATIRASDAADGESGSASPPHPVGAGDVAVLCRTKKWARDIAEALHGFGIASVLRVDDSVFDSPEAAELQAVMDAASNPSHARSLRAALVTDLIGLGALDIEALGERPEAWEEWLGAARQWQACWQAGGAIALLEKILLDHGSQERLLSAPGGERRLTNFLHLAELVQQAAQRGGMGPRALHTWLGRMRIDARARSEETTEDALVRLESDAQAVQLLTIHRSKGLQYPIVYCPDLWQGGLLKAEDAARPRFHDPEDGFRLKLDLGSPGQSAAANRMRWESLAENRRLLYVALTRAMQRLVVVCGPFTDAGASALGFLLHPPPGAVPLDPDASDDFQDACRSYVKNASDAELRAQLAELEAASDGAIAVEPLAETPAVAELPVPPAAPRLAPRLARRRLARRWRVSSFSGLAAGASGGAGATRPDSHPASQGLDYDASGAAPAGAERVGDADEAPVVLHAFPAGAGPGTMIHQIFERIDFALPDAGALARELDAALARHGLGAELAPVLGAGIRQVLATPLGGPLEGFCLRDLPRCDRVDEMEFTLPVANSGSPPLTASSLADVFAAHAGDAVSAGYVERLRGFGFSPLQGHLRGFIDLSFRQGDRFYLADYKSNQLGRLPGDYGPDKLRASMEHHDYVLQYHLYTVALHRHLGRRLPGYDYDSHMGGAYYLFLRGMAPESPGGLGIFYDRPPRRLIEALSACLGDDAPGAQGGAE